MRTSSRDLLKGPLAWATLAAVGAVVGPSRLGAHPHPKLPEARARLFEAALEGDLQKLRVLLEADPGLIHARDLHGRSAFAVGLLGGNQEVGTLLRERGYQPDVVETALALDWETFEALAAKAPGTVNQAHPIGGNAMYAAALGGAGSETWRVMAFGGDSNAVSRTDTPGGSGFSAVRAALDHPDLNVAEIMTASLIGNGGDPNVPQAGGSSPLHAAAARGSTVMVEMLVRLGAKVDAKDDHGRTPVDLAAERGQRATERMLRDHSKIPRTQSTSRTAYDAEGRPYSAPDLSAFSQRTRNHFVGRSHGDFETVRRMTEFHPALVHAQATSTEITVEACGHIGQRPIVDYLLEKGAPYSLPTAVMRGDLERARALLAEDPNRIHERGPHDFALLWYPTIGGGQIELTELLLEYGAEVEQQHFLGTTALHWAAGSGQVEIAALLIEKGADVNRPGRKFGSVPETPLDLAKKRKQAATEKLLRDHGATS